MNADMFEFPGLIRLGQHDGEVGLMLIWRVLAAQHGTQLVATLRAYLDCWGDYPRTARLLGIHTSTVRYRVHRIRQVLAADLTDSSTRFNRQVATHLLGYSERGRQIQR